MPLVKDLIQDRHSPLAYIFTKVRELQNLTAKLNELLPEEFKGQCVVLNLRNGLLTLGLKQQSLISRLYYTKDDLIVHLQAHESFRYVRKLKVVGVNP